MLFRSDLNEKEAITDIIKISKEVLDHKRTILYSETLGKHKAFEGIREALWYSHVDEELGYTIHIAGLISFEKGRSYNPLLERHSAIFSIFAQQAVLLLGNFTRGLTIRDQVEKISESATELRKLSLIATKTKSGVIITDQ